MRIRAACIILFAGFWCYAQEPVASLSGTVQDRTGSVIPTTLAVLESETDPSRRFLTRADEQGVYRFLELSPGVYRLTLKQPGFRDFLLKAVQLASSEAKSMPLVTLIEVNNGCGPLYYSAMPPPHSGLHTGNLAGQVVDYDGAPIADADVSLICGKGRVCSRIRTNSKGEFAFGGIAPGNYGLLIGRTFFYSLFEPSLEVRHDQELMYRPISLERCSEKYCDPARRPKPHGTVTFCQ